MVTNNLVFCKGGFFVAIGNAFTVVKREEKRESMMWAKRTLDIALSLIALAIFSLPLLAISLLIKLEDGGPIFFWQKRVGKDGVEFDFPKFRSMVTNAEEIKKNLAEQNQHGGEGVTFKMRNDPRVTKIGRVLRRLSLDEMPQLWCVLRGDMSMVGPRPALPSEVEKYTQEQRKRLSVEQGITCIWQVSGRGDIPFEEQVALDMEYIAKRSFWFDVVLLLKTIPAVILGRGAY
jgi:lipopolysaccharide/colanic/teichoic acid biosynthesis glycosyltransferase